MSGDRIQYGDDEIRFSAGNDQHLEAVLGMYEQKGRVGPIDGDMQMNLQYRCVDCGYVIEIPSTPAIVRKKKGEILQAARQLLFVTGWQKLGQQGVGRCPSCAEGIGGVDDGKD